MIEKYKCTRTDGVKCAGGYGFGPPYCHSIENCMYKQEVVEVPYNIGTVLYAPNRLHGKVMSVDRYRVTGYGVYEYGTVIKLLPLSFYGITCERLIKDLYTTEEAAKEGK